MVIDYQTFHNLYPDVDPAERQTIGLGERFCFALAVAVLCWGAGTGEIIITGIGFLLVIGVIAYLAFSTHRRIRREARERFPELDWSEHHANDVVRAGWLIPMCWAAVVIICLLSFYLVPIDQAMWGGVISAVAGCVIAWFMPGYSAAWLPRQDGESTQEDGELVEEDEEPSESYHAWTEDPEEKLPLDDSYSAQTAFYDDHPVSLDTEQLDLRDTPYDDTAK